MILDITWVATHGFSFPRTIIPYIYVMRFRYSEQIMSRLEGEYQVLTFRGDDIRKKKNAL
jgi:hypothetical protein